MHTTGDRESVTSLKSKEASAESDNDSNYSDSELWLCPGQKIISRKSKKMSKKINKQEQQKELQNTNTHVGTIKPKVKPATFPKPKWKPVIGHAGATEKSVAHKDKILKSQSAKEPLRLASDGSDPRR